jgi:hypothetical protein
MTQGEIMKTTLAALFVLVTTTLSGTAFAKLDDYQVAQSACTERDSSLNALKPVLQCSGNNVTVCLSEDRRGRIYFKQVEEGNGKWTVNELSPSEGKGKIKRGKAVFQAKNVKEMGVAKVTTTFVADLASGRADLAVNLRPTLAGMFIGVEASDDAFQLDCGIAQ